MKRHTCATVPFLHIVMVKHLHRDDEDRVLYRSGKLVAILVCGKSNVCVSTFVNASWLVVAPQLMGSVALAPECLLLLGSAWQQ